MYASSARPRRDAASASISSRIFWMLARAASGVAKFSFIRFGSRLAPMLSSTCEATEVPLILPLHSPCARRSSWRMISKKTYLIHQQGDLLSRSSTAGTCGACSPSPAGAERGAGSRPDCGDICSGARRSRRDKPRPEPARGWLYGIAWTQPQRGQATGPLHATPRAASWGWRRSRLVTVSNT